MAKFSPHELTMYAAALLNRLGVEVEASSLVAETLVDAEARGNASHGLTHLLLYARRIREGSVKTTARPEVVSDRGNTVVIDGDQGLGQIAASLAVETALAKAKRGGIGFAIVRNNTTFGAGAYYAERITREDCVGLVFSNSGPIMAPWGGKLPILGNSPFAIGLPAKDSPPFLLDMACSVTARGNIQLALEQGKSLAEGLALDSEGNPTTDPAQALAGSVLPFGSYKGYGLAFAIELITGALSGSELTSEGMPRQDLLRPTGRSQAFIAIDIAHLLPVDSFKERVQHMIEQAINSPTRGDSQIRVPGNNSERRRQDSMARGIELHETTFAALQELGQDLGLAPPAAIQTRETIYRSSSGEQPR